MFPQGSGELLCTCASAFTYVNVPSCPTIFSRHLRQCLRQGSALPCTLRCLFMHLRQCMRGASVGKPVPTVVFCCPHVHGSLVFFSSAILHSSIFSGLFPSSPSLFFHCVYYISETGALLSFCVGLMVGLLGIASHGSSFI